MQADENVLLTQLQQMHQQNFLKQQVEEQKQQNQKSRIDPLPTPVPRSSYAVKFNKELKEKFLELALIYLYLLLGLRDRATQ
jgi:hypothetical protein